MKKPLAVKFNEMMLTVLVISGFVGLVLWGALGMTESNRMVREENCQREYATVACFTVKLQEAHPDFGQDDPLILFIFVF